jgi:hypothetical protein
MHDGGSLDLDSLIAIARSERSGEIAPATASRLAQFQAAFDAAAAPAAAPTAICFAFHASVPQAEAAVKYRDIAIDHSKFDYDRIVRHCIAAALAAQPGARFILATDNQFLTDIEHPALTIVRLPLDQASPMYERVIAMCAFVRSRQFTAPTAFLDSDAFLNAPIANLFQGHFDIGATYRPDPGLMPINEGVIFAASRQQGRGARLLRRLSRHLRPAMRQRGGDRLLRQHQALARRAAFAQCPDLPARRAERARQRQGVRRAHPLLSVLDVQFLDRHGPPLFAPAAGQPRGAAPEGPAQGCPGSDHHLPDPALAADRAALRHA